MHLEQAIRGGYIYVVHYPLYDGLNPITDDPFGELMEANSPIAIFASKPSHQRLPNRLKPVAIQINSSPGIISTEFYTYIVTTLPRNYCEKLSNN